MARNKTSFSWDAGRIRKNIIELDGEIDRAIKALCGYHSSHGEIYAKTNAPWTDRTGAARTGLFTETVFPGKSYIIVFAHTVEYGIWLEVANSGDYQIIMPSVRKVGRDVMQDLDGLMKRLKGRRRR